MYNRETYFPKGGIILNLKNLNNHNLLKSYWMKPLIGLMMAVIFLCNSFSIATTIAFAKTNPRTYYHNLEKEYLKQNIDSISKAYDTLLSQQQNTSNQQTGRETTLQAALDSSLTDGTSFEGLKTMKASIISMVKGKDSKTSTTIFCNDEKLTSIETYTFGDILYILIPDLSKAYLKLDYKSLQGESSASPMQFNAMSEDTLLQLTKRYGNIIIDHIKNVTMKRNVCVDADNIKDYDTKLAVTISEKDALNIAKAVLQIAKSDNKLSQLCVDSSICTSKEYKSSIKDAISEINHELKDLKKKKSNGKSLLKMDVFVNDQGAIAGRTIKLNIDKDTVNLGYKTARSCNKMGVELWVKTKDAEFLHGNGRFTAGLKGTSGDFIISYPSTEKDTSSSIYIDFRDVKYDQNEALGRLNGEFTITGDDLEDMAYNIKFTGEAGKQEVLFDMLQNNKSVATVTATTKTIPFTDFIVPSSEDKIYDITTQSEDYLQDADVKGYLNGIKDKSSLDCIDSYMDELIADYENNKESLTDDLESEFDNVNPFYNSDKYDDSDYIY